jgi:hypothetical protein
VVKPAPADISDAIEECYKNNRLETFAENVRIEKAKYSWSMMTASVREVLNKSVTDDHKK